MLNQDSKITKLVFIDNQLKQVPQEIVQKFKLYWHY